MIDLEGVERGAVTVAAVGRETEGLAYGGDVG